MKQLCGPTVALTVIILVAGAARAQQNAQLEPDAMAALRNMGGYLRSLKAFQVDAVTTKEDVLEDGQKVTFGGVTNLLARVPDRLRISVDSDRKKRLYVYDGQTFTMFARRVNYYATVPAPPTIGQLAEGRGKSRAGQSPVGDLMARFSLALFLALLVNDTTAIGARDRGGVRSASRSSVTRNVHRDVDVNRDRHVDRDIDIDRDLNIDRNIDLDRDIDIDRDFDVDIDNGGGCCYRGGWGTAAAVATTAAVTAAVVGSAVYTLPPSCSVVVVDGFTYQQCGSVWYQPQISGGSTTYVVVNAPR